MIDDMSVFFNVKIFAVTEALYMLEQFSGKEKVINSYFLIRLRGTFKQSLKETVMEFLKHQSDNIPAEDIIEFVMITQKLLEGEQDLQNGKTYTHEQAIEILKK